METITESVEEPAQPVRPVLVIPDWEKIVDSAFANYRRVPPPL